MLTYSAYVHRVYRSINGFDQNLIVSWFGNIEIIPDFHGGPLGGNDDSLHIFPYRLAQL
jgi:hypothetical protein